MITSNCSHKLTHDVIYYHGFLSFITFWHFAKEVHSWMFLLRFLRLKFVRKPSCLLVGFPKKMISKFSCFYNLFY